MLSGDLEGLPILIEEQPGGSTSIDADARDDLVGAVLRYGAKHRRVHPSTGEILFRARDPADGRAGVLPHGAAVDAAPQAGHREGRLRDDDQDQEREVEPDVTAFLPPGHDGARFDALAGRAEAVGLQAGVSQGLDSREGEPPMYRLRRPPADVPTLDALEELIALEESLHAEDVEVVPP